MILAGIMVRPGHGPRITDHGVGVFDGFFDIFFGIFCIFFDIFIVKVVYKVVAVGGGVCWNRPPSAACRPPARWRARPSASCSASCHTSCTPSPAVVLTFTDDWCGAASSVQPLCLSIASFQDLV